MNAKSKVYNSFFAKKYLFLSIIFYKIGEYETITNNDFD